jgi:hypothetical protein
MLSFHDFIRCYSIASHFIIHCYHPTHPRLITPCYRISCYQLMLLSDNITQCYLPILSSYYHHKLSPHFIILCYHAMLLSHVIIPCYHPTLKSHVISQLLSSHVVLPTLSSHDTASSHGVTPGQNPSFVLVLFLKTSVTQILLKSSQAERTKK